MLRVLSIMMILLVVGCQNQNCRDSVEPGSITLEVARLERGLFDSKSQSEVEVFLENNPVFAKLFLDADEYPSNAVLANKLFTLIQNPSIDTLYNEASEAFDDFDDFIGTLEGALGRLQVYYPDVTIPKIQTVVTGLYKDLIITNHHVMIGMDFFIGSDASYPPQQIPNYILHRYDVEHLPANIIQFLSSQYIQPAADDTMLSEMIDHGKSYYLLSKLLPCTPKNVLIGYTPEEWKESEENDAIIWANFIENELLYETNHHMKQKFLGERPNVYEIGDKCPGRIGRWLGWQMVEQYAKNTGTSVQDIMREKEANKIFRLSKYKPSGR